MPNPRKPHSYVDEWKSQWEPDLEAIGCVNGNSCDPTKVDPKVLEWAKDNCIDKPHFIKIINSGAAKGRPGLKQKNASSITVPSPFVRKHFKRLGRVITLESEDGRTWRVSFGTPKRDPQWLQGWERVATENNFKPGDIVVFVLVADSHFRFTLFDEDGNISERTTSTLNNAAAENQTRCSSQESHEAPSVSNLDEHPKTKKRALISDNIQPPPEAEMPIPPGTQI
ncbi:hypothetical protein M758_8G104400 [Ceratodon purpureus]|nr:hypothetical protein M758_8G104400 [Ceratodon purpureus]